MGGYFFIAMIVAFIVSGALGLLVEWAMIRHLYSRPLDTLLATWGLSLIMQQAFRSTFGAREVGIDLPQWMMGSLPVFGIDRSPDQRPVGDGHHAADHRHGRACCSIARAGACRCER